jgi:LacI family transcriptional regulator
MATPGKALRSERGGRSGPTIHDVARLAEVSIGTASKALNDNGRLKPETRERVLKVAREIGYRPNSLAQSLHRAKSMTVGLISNDSFGRFNYPIAEALEERLAQEGVAVFMCNATDDPQRERQHIEQLLGKRIDGIVVTARRADKRPALVVPRGLPVIYVYSQADDRDALCLVPDDQGGARLATRHLIEIGRRRIAHVTGPERFDAVGLRRRGYEDALAEAGLAVPAGYYLSGPWTEAWGREATAQLFDGTEPAPEALFCGNDLIARGAIETLRERGRPIPDEVAVIGFDNWDVMVTATRPPLSSIDMNLQEMGRQAGDALLQMIGGQRLNGIRRLPCTLVPRASTTGREP